MSLPLLYRHTAADDSLLAQNDLLFRPSTEEVEAVDGWGMKATPIDATPVRSDSVLIMLMIAFVCGLAYWRKRKSWLVGFLFCLQGSLLAFIAMRHLHLSASATPEWLSLTTYVLVMFAYICFKQLLYHWVHCVFFSAAQRALWRRHFTFLLMLETVSFFPLLLLCLFVQIDVFIGAQILVVVLLFVKIWLLWRCFSVFFRKKYGLLHLFVYFCALEGTPLVVLSASVIEITRILTFIQ